MNINNIHEICANETLEFTKPNYWVGAWDEPIYYRKMFATLIKEYKTNIVEIGSHNGSTTYFLGKILEPFNKKIYTIDPWNGAQEGNDSIYKDYLNNTKELTNLVTMRESSLSHIAYWHLKNTDYGICYIDGLHTREGIRNDIRVVSATIKAPYIILIDDYDMPEIADEIDIAAKENIIQLINPPNQDMFYNNYPDKGRKFAICVKGVA